MLLRSLTLLAGVAALVTAVPAQAVHSVYQADVNTLNDSGVSGTAILEVNPDTRILTIDMTVIGLEPNMDHIMHIHGLLDGDGSSGNQALDSMTPTLANDSDGDGFVEVIEGVPSYGDILLPLTTMNTPDGTFIYSDTFDLDDSSLFMSPVTGNEYVGDDLLPLEFREIVIHGLTVDGSAGANTEGEIDGTAGYKAVLPVAAGEIYRVPEPATALLAGIALLGVVTVFRRA
ncbi:PEP-CTERM sorting domain-containing protein [Aeoliella mucimassa]|uniref:Ice-binding protein C-terminal domain-containing protein n=1 Tax=Aeoliella mucimassa TaxID=2527972 RepID=A0A518AQ48_9BACT|nr:PEP-CTERM sorting domain-containing protein [Aeoliella mucimassa]QDU56851.1 hypothetical protein Pan181_30630 [Aeoliella mucimassa]